MCVWVRVVQVAKADEHKAMLEKKRLEEIEAEKKDHSESSAAEDKVLSLSLSLCLSVFVSLFFPSFHLPSLPISLYLSLRRSFQLSDVL